VSPNWYCATDENGYEVEDITCSVTEQLNNASGRVRANVKKWGKVLMLSVSYDFKGTGMNLKQDDFIGRLSADCLPPYVTNTATYYDDDTAYGVFRIYNNGRIQFAALPFYGTPSNAGAYNCSSGTCYALEPYGKIDITYIAQ
jgi:hypothetical protein